jgi:hypothetical protein
LPTEVCGKDTPAGLALRDRLARARGAFLGERPPADAERLTPARPAKAVRERGASSTGDDRAGGVAVKGKGGRPPGARPWKDRKAEYKRAYMRDYMRGRRARVISA